MMALSFTKIKETCLYISDINQTRDFYHDKLGLPIISEVERNHVFFRAGECVLLCFIPSVSKNKKHLPAHYGEGILHFAFECEKEQYVKWKEHVINAGIDIEHEETWDGGVKSFYFRDPDRHSVEIVMKGMWGNAD